MSAIQDALDRWGVFSILGGSKPTISISENIVDECVPFIVQAQNFIDIIGCLLGDRNNLEDADTWELLRKDAVYLLTRYREFRKVPVSKNNLKIIKPFESFEAGTRVKLIKSWFDAELTRIVNKELEDVPQYVYWGGDR